MWGFDGLTISFNQVGLPFLALAGIASLQSFRSRRSLSDDYSVEEMEDVISQLPDEVLCFVISKLSTQEAVKTSILSTRWRNLYKFTTRITFHCRDMLGFHSIERDEDTYWKLQQFFLEGVHTFLQLHSGCKITSFNLFCCSPKFSEDSFYKLFHYFGNVGVEQLKLSNSCAPYSPVSSHNAPSTFPCHLLLSKTPFLKYLRLERFFVNNLIFESPCNSLNTLYFDHVCLAPGAVEVILANCMSLNSFTLVLCKLPPNLHIHGSNILFLMIELCFDLEKIDLHAKKLDTFKISNGRMLEIVFDHVPLLQNLSISLYGENAMPYAFGELTRYLCQLKRLSFATDDNYYRGLDRLPGVIYSLSNLNLKELVLCVTSSHKFDLRKLSLFFDAYPYLQRFSLVNKRAEFDGQRVAEVSGVHHSELKEVEFLRFGGSKNEVDFALYILKIGAVLERMYISLCPYTWSNEEPLWDEEKQNMMCQQFQEQALSHNVVVTMEVSHKHMGRLPDRSWHPPNVFNY